MGAFPPSLTTRMHPPCAPYHSQELNGQKDELTSKVGALKGDLQEWRRRLEANVQGYKGEVRLQLPPPSALQRCHRHQLLKCRCSTQRTARC